MKWLEYLKQHSSMHQWLSGKKDAILQPVVPLLLWANLTPNAITLAGAALGLISVYALLAGSYWWFVVFSMISLLFDGLDGTLARAQHTSSSTGKQLDLLTDTIIMALTFISLSVYVQQLLWLVGLVIFLCFFIVLRILSSSKQLVPARIMLLLPCWVGLPVIGLGLVSAYGSVMGSYALITAKRN